MNIDRSPAGHSNELAPNASNLPEVLSVLQANPIRFEKYNALVRRVLPQITHSPELISASDPQRLALLRKPQGQPTEVIQLQSTDTRDMRALLIEVGARLSDVLGADRVLWVEGKTEEECLKIIVRRILKKSLAGTVLVGVMHTSDFEARGADVDRILGIYLKLSAANAALPPAVGFIFDRELRRDTQVDDLRRRSKGAVEFLPRRSYENYLLSPQAIAAILAVQFAECNVQACPPTPKVVDEWLEAHRREDRFNSNVPNDQVGNDDVVNASELLAALFLSLSANTLEYRKTIHSVLLTEWIVEHEPDRLRAVADLLDKKLTSAPPNSLGGSS